MNLCFDATVLFEMKIDFDEPHSHEKTEMVRKHLSLTTATVTATEVVSAGVETDSSAEHSSSY